jgi:hypothetical protein
LKATGKLENSSWQLVRSFRLHHLDLQVFRSFKLPRIIRWMISGSWFGIRTRWSLRWPRTQLSVSLGELRSIKSKSASLLVINNETKIQSRQYWPKDKDETMTRGHFFLKTVDFIETSSYVLTEIDLTNLKVDFWCLNSIRSKDNHHFLDQRNEACLTLPLHLLAWSSSSVFDNSLHRIHKIPGTKTRRTTKRTWWLLDWIFLGTTNRDALLCGPRSNRFDWTLSSRSRCWWSDSTGTLAVAFNAIQMFDKTRKIDLPSCTMRVKKDRRGALETYDQYTFCYKTMLEYVRSQLKTQTKVSWESLLGDWIVS